VLESRHASRLKRQDLGRDVSADVDRAHRGNRPAPEYALGDRAHLVLDRAVSDQPRLVEPFVLPQRKEVTLGSGQCMLEHNDDHVGSCKVGAHLPRTAAEHLLVQRDSRVGDRQEMAPAIVTGPLWAFEGPPIGNLTIRRGANCHGCRGSARRGQSCFNA
jgi:hypothetical protein